MTRVLHVIDQPGQVPEAAVLKLSVDSVRLEAASNPDQHAWLLFGGQAMRDAAHVVGLRDGQFLLLPKPVGVYRWLSAALAKPKELMDQAHRVVCWTSGAAQIASRFGCAHVVRRVDDASLSPFARRIIAKANADLAASQTVLRDRLRGQWDAEEQTFVVALLGDRFDAVDALVALIAVISAHESLVASQPDCAEVRLLCHPLAKRRADAARLGELLSFDRIMVQDAQVAMPWSVLPGCDIALTPNPSEAGLSILWAQAAGVPVLVPGDRRLAMLDELEHRVAARSSAPKDLADALANWAQSRTVVSANA